ncbi:MAG: aldehyde dehydrogenase family protein [Thermoplasmata archaeon]
MSRIYAVDRITSKRTEYSESSPAKIRDDISSILDRTAPINDDSSDLIKNIIDVLHSNSAIIAGLITEDTGKGVSASKKEIAAALEILRDNINVKTEAFAAYNKDKNGSSRIAFRSGISIIYPDMWCPVLSLIERLVPALHTRKLVVVSPDSRAFTAVKMLFDEIDPLTALKGGLVVSLFADQTKTMSLMHRERVSDLLFSGSIEDLSRIRHHCDFCSIRAEAGEGFPIVVTEDSNLDDCAISIADIFLDFSRSPFRRPAVVVVEASAEEYLENRLVEEITKHNTGDPLSESTSVGFAQNPERASTAAALLLSGKNRTHDILHWDGYREKVFHPALVREASGSSKLKGFNELPLLKMRSMASIQDGFIQVVQSGNLMFASIWSSDPYLEELANQTLPVSSIYFNLVPWLLPVEWKNPMVNEGVVQGPDALIKSMFSQKTLLHRI